MQGGECDPSEWDLYGDPRGSHHTISGLAPQINSIVVGYLGTFCSFTYVAYINPPNRENFCSYCRVRGHQFSHDPCVREVVERLREQNAQVFAPRVRDDSVFLQARHEQVEYFQDSDVRDGPVAPLPAPKRKRK